MQHYEKLLFDQNQKLQQLHPFYLEFRDERFCKLINFVLNFQPQQHQAQYLRLPLKLGRVVIEVGLLFPCRIMFLTFVKDLLVSNAFFP